MTQSRPALCTWLRSSMLGPVASSVTPSAARSMHGSLLLHSRPPSAPAIHQGVACIIPTVGRNMPPMTIAPPCRSTVSPAPNPYDNAKAESFMKTLKVEAVYLMAYETFEDV